MGDVQHALLELLEAFQFDDVLEELFLHQLHGSPVHGAREGFERLAAHLGFVVEEPSDFIELTGEYRFRNVGQAPGFEHPAYFLECLIHALDGYMMQGLEHQEDVEAVVGLVNCFSAVRLERNVRQVRYAQILVMLVVVYFRRHDFGNARLLGNLPGLFRGPAAEFEHACTLQRQQLPEYGKLAVDFLMWRSLNLHGRFASGKLRFNLAFCPGGGSPKAVERAALR